MSRLAALLAFLVVLGAVAAVQAQEAAPGAAEAALEPPDIPPGDDVITAMAEGSRALHAGMLLDTDTAIRWTNRLSWFRNELRLVLRTDSEILSALRRSHETELRIVRTSYEREIEGLRGDLRQQAQTFAAARAAEHPWFDTFAFGAVIGVVLSGVLVGLVAWAASSM
jgi:hypothetical protein